MMTPFGIGEFITLFITVAFGLALPVGILYILYKIYVRLKSIDEKLKKN